MPSDNSVEGAEDVVQNHLHELEINPWHITIAPESYMIYPRPDQIGHISVDKTAEYNGGSWQLHTHRLGQCNYQTADAYPLAFRMYPRYEQHSCVAAVLGSVKIGGCSK